MLSLEKISDLKNKILKTEQLVEELVLSLEHKKNQLNAKEEKILKLKVEIKNNIKKIDAFIKEYNAKS